MMKVFIYLNSDNLHLIIALLDNSVNVQEFSNSEEGNDVRKHRHKINVVCFFCS